jgi:hypothetical protein
MHGNVQVSVRRGGVGVPAQSGPGLLPDSFRRFHTDRPDHRRRAFQRSQADTHADFRRRDMKCDTAFPEAYANGEPSSLSERTAEQSCQPLRQCVYRSRHGQGRQNGTRSQAEQDRRE